jgi:hypothetical protein
VRIGHTPYRDMEGWQSLVYRGGLENRYTARYRGFESSPLRFSTYSEKLSTRKGDSFFAQYLEKKNGLRRGTVRVEAVHRFFFLLKNHQPEM